MRPAQYYTNLAPLHLATLSGGQTALLKLEVLALPDWSRTPCIWEFRTLGVRVQLGRASTVHKKRWVTSNELAHILSTLITLTPL